MTTNQRKARNEAWQLLTVASRILDDAGLIAYHADVDAVLRSMNFDAEMERKQFRDANMPA